MYPILEKRLLAEGIWLMKVLAPRVARSAQPGQFVIVRVDEHGERIPLTISDFDAAEGSVTIVTQAIGASTRKICALNEGDALADFAGPLGHPSEFVKMPVEELRPRRYLIVAGGEGSVMALPIVGEYMKKIYDDGRFGISRTDQFVRPAMMPRYDCEDEVDSEGRNNPEDENFFD